MTSTRQDSAAPDSAAPSGALFPNAKGSDAENQDTASQGMVQLLDQDGALRADPDFSGYVADVDAQMLRGFYRDMALTRRFDQEATALQRQGQLALWVPLRGQEAAQIGSGRATRPHDYIFPTYREHGVALTRDVDFPQMLRIFRGISNGGWDPRENNFHMYTMVLAAQVPHATGYAMGIQRDQAGWNRARLEREGTAVVAYFGDGASSEGDAHEALNLAGVRRAPVVFVLKNNGWAISTPVRKQTAATSFADRAPGYGIAGERVDGNDLVAVHAATSRAVARARAGEGPTLIEAVTYRMGPHNTADDPTRYVDPVELDEHRELDPVDRMRRHLLAEGLVDAAGEERVVEELTAEFDAAFAAVEAAEPPGPEALFDHVYERPPERLEQQRLQDGP